MTLPTLLSSYDWTFAIPFLMFNLIIVPFLVATTMILSISKFNELKHAPRKSGGFAVLGMFGGLLGGACPGCFVGLFPAFLGIFGISASLGVLPLFGLELQVISSILLLFAVGYLTRETVCMLPVQK